MDFLTQQVALPFWLLLLMIAGLVPLFIKIFVRIDFIRNKLKSFLEEDEEEFLTDSQMKTIVPTRMADDNSAKPKRITESKILKLLATKGDQGMLLQSIADTLKIDSNATNRALKYLESKEMVDAVNSMGGNKYFLTNAGKNYCTKKGYVKTAA